MNSRMRRAIAVHRCGAWPEEAAIDSVTLPFIDRHRRRIRLVADSGTPFLLDLPRAQHLSEGDGLEFDNGQYLRVRAAPEPVVEIEAASGAIHDRATLQSWIVAIVAQGSGRMDAAILRDAYRAALAEDAAALVAANIRGLAYRATAELALESTQQGGAFFVAWEAAWDDVCLQVVASENDPSPPFRGEREGPIAERWEGEVGGIGERSGIPHLTPALSAPEGGEGVKSSVLALQNIC